MGAMPLGDGAQPCSIFRCRHGSATALQLNQHELQGIAAFDSASRLAMVLTHRQ